MSEYTAADSLVGKEVTVYAQLAYYSGTYETASYEVKINGQSQDPKVYENGKIVAIADGSRHATSVELSVAADFEMEQGEEKTLTATIKPYGSVERITWSKSGTAADKVTLDNGKVTVAEDAVVGTSVTITATAKEGVAASVTITVKAQAVAYTKIDTDVFANSFTGDAETATFSSGVATFLLEKASSTTNNRLSDANHLRVYKNARLTISVSSGTLGKVELNLTDGTNGYANAANLTLETGVEVAFEGNVATFTLPANATQLVIVAANQIRLNHANIFYVPAE